MNANRIEDIKIVSFGNTPFDSAEKDLIQRTLQKVQPLTNSSISQLTSDITLDRMIKSRIDAANNLFFFNGWSDRIINLNVDYIEQEMNQWCVGVTAIVRVTLKDGSFHENVGFAEVKNSSKGVAMKEAKTQAVLVARQQCFQTYGMYFAGTEPFLSTKEEDPTPPSSKVSSQFIESTINSQLRSFDAKANQGGNQREEERKPVSLHPYKPQTDPVPVQTPAPVAQSPILSKPLPPAQITQHAQNIQPQHAQNIQPQHAQNIQPPQHAQPVQPQHAQITQPPQHAQITQPPQPAKKPMDQMTETDMEGLDDLDLANLTIEMSPQDPLPPANPIPSTVPLRNQAMMQGIQPNVMHRSSDGSPIIRTPIQSTGNTYDMMNTVQGNAFSMKRNTPFISF